MHTGTILITGAGRGLGLEFARQYVAEGWRVIACCRSPEKAPELKKLGRKVETHALDVTSQDSIQHLAKTLNGTPIDVLLNNAGLHGDRMPFGATDPELWKKILEVNTIAPVQMTAALLENVAASAQKKVVSISSKVGSIGDGPGGGSYAYRSSKTALNMAMVNAAHELKGRGITILLIHPGWVQTDMGGPSAPVGIEQSITGVRRIIDKATLAETGHFYDYTGKQLPGEFGRPSMILTEEQQQIVDMARAFAEGELKPHATEWEAAGYVPDAIVTKMGELGLMGMLVPEEWGGAGVDYGTYALVVEELAAGDASVSTLMSVHTSVVCLPILNFGTEAQKQRFLRPLSTGGMVGAFCLTEPGAGSDAAAIKTRAVRDGDSYVLNGSKQFISNGKRCHVALVIAVTDPAAGKKGISAFLVPQGTKGFEVARLENKLGQRASDTAQLAFQDCRIPADLRLGEEGEGLKIALANLEGGRIGIAAQAIGMARSAFEEAVKYSKERKTFGKPIAEHQAIAFRLADMATQIEAARALTQHACAVRASGQRALKHAAMAKLFASEMAEKVCSDAIQIHGGYGFLKDFLVERIYRDVRVCKIYEGTSDIQKIIISRELLSA